MKTAPALVPDDVITEILSWLPVKPLVRFSCVSKFWKSLFSDPQFIELHLQRSPKNVNLLVYSDLNYVMSCSKSAFIQNPCIAAQHGFNCYNYSFAGSCNGLVCLLYRYSLEDFFVNFFNPETRLSSGHSPCLHIDKHGRSFSFSIMIEFGYDKSSNTYKVVALLIDQLKTEVKVYTMGEPCWRDIQTFPAFPLTIFGNLNGTLNWLAYRNMNRGINYEELVIVSLDLGKETYKQFLPPDGVEYDEIFIGPPYTAILDDCLCLFVDYKATHFVVWQMKEFGVEKSWTRFFNVSYQHLHIGPEPHPLFLMDHFHSLVPLCTLGNGDVFVFLNRNDFEIILYNWRDNTVEVGKCGRNKHLIKARDHVQSLVLPRSH